MMTSRSKGLGLAVAALTSAALAPAALAAPFVVPKAQLTAPAITPGTIVTFDEVPAGTPYDAGLTIKGFTFSDNATGFLINPGGPGDTNNVTQPGIPSGSLFPGYVLNVALPGPSSAMGFGFALLDSPQANALTVTLFNGPTNLGSLNFSSANDPSFPGGFAGIGNATPFDHVQITFPSTVAQYDLDNFAAVAAPEPTTATLLLISLAGLLTRRRRS